MLVLQAKVLWHLAMQQHLEKVPEKQWFHFVATGEVKPPWGNTLSPLTGLLRGGKKGGGGVTKPFRVSKVLWKEGK